MPDRSWQGMCNSHSLYGQTVQKCQTVDPPASSLQSSLFLAVESTCVDADLEEAPPKMLNSLSTDAAIGLGGLGGVGVGVVGVDGAGEETCRSDCESELPTCMQSNNRVRDCICSAPKRLMRYSNRAAYVFSILKCDICTCRHLHSRNTNSDGGTFLLLTQAKSATSLVMMLAT